MLKGVLLFLFISNVLCSNLYPQSVIGLPDVINYNKQTYKAGLQNWGFAQDDSGVLYIANNEGLLTYDGRSFKLFALPNKTIVRSIVRAHNKIYVGGQDEIGYFEPDHKGQLVYKSLVGLLPSKDRVFGDIWDVIAYNDDLYFRGTKKIFRLAGDQFSTFEAPTEWRYMGVANNKIYAQDYVKGLMVFDKEGWKPCLQHTNNFTVDNLITAILPLDKERNIITTLKNGLFVQHAHKIEPFKTSINKKFIEERIYHAYSVGNDMIALVTKHTGVFILNKYGEIIQQISNTEGLQNTNILAVFLDAQSNLWLGTENGIDMVRFDSPIKQIAPLQKDDSGYAMLFKNNILYIGTSRGLYSIPIKDSNNISATIGSFRRVSDIEGQIWRMDTISNEIFIGGHEGAYIFTGGNIRRISKEEGFWNFLPLQRSNGQRLLVAGGYNGIRLFEDNNGQYIQQQNIPSFVESSRFVAIDEFKNIWVSHPYHGVYKVTKNAKGDFVNKLYNHNNGLPSKLNNHIFKVKGEVIVATEKGIYNYDYKNDAFRPSDFYAKLLGNLNIRYLKEDKEGNIWFVQDKTVGVIDWTQGKEQINYIPELTGKLLSGFEFIYPVNKNNILIAAERGIIIVDYAKYSSKRPKIEVQISKVVLNNKIDSVLFGGFLNATQRAENNNPIEIKDGWKSLHFEFSTALFGYEENIEYSYRLKGFDNNWSEYNKVTIKEYTNLPAGSYIFEVKSRYNDYESLPASYSFKVLPIWYLTIWAKIVYSAFFLTALFIFYKWLKRKFRNQRLKYEEEQKRLVYIYDLEKAKADSELIILHNANLEAEINHKKTELASNAMHLVKKAELLTKIKTDLLQVSKAAQNPFFVQELNKMIRSLNDGDKMDEEWKNFTLHFDQVHDGFFKSLKEIHPTITNSEVKLSAYLRMNLSTKEIAQLSNISVRGVEIGRYRLRKKLKLEPEANLFDYLIKIGN